MMAYVKILLVVFLQLSLEVNSVSQFKSFLRKIGSTLLSGSILLSPVASFAASADISLTEQLRNFRTVQESNTKTRIETEEADAISRALQYPDGYLVARGIVTLVSDEGYPGPYGVPDAYLVNADLGKDEATMILLAVGREGPPLAAKRISSINTKKFPLVVEITCDDLLFPYTSSAWQNSANKLDTIAMTVILSSDDKLATATPSDRIGLGESALTNIAGVNTRTTATMYTYKKIDLSMYAKDEIELLAGIDSALDRRGSGSPISSTSSLVKK